MLGRVLESFDDETLGRFLTSKMGWGMFCDEEGNRCFWGVVVDAAYEERWGARNGGFDAMRAARTRFGVTPWRTYGYVDRSSTGGSWYNALCRRFGTERIATAIRTRALTILAKRELSRGSSPTPLQESVVGS